MGDTLRKIMPPEYEFRIVVREPSWEKSAMLWEEFGDAGDAEEFIKDIAPTYPEGTLFFITYRFYDHLYTRKSFVVNEYGELEKRRRKWVPDSYVPLEWIKKIPPEPISPYKDVEGYEELSEEEKENLNKLLYQMGVDPRAHLNWERKMEKGYFAPGELEDW